MPKTYRLPNGRIARVVPWPTVSGFLMQHDIRRDNNAGPPHVTGRINAKLNGHRQKCVPGKDVEQ